ncbi:hypothetical protein [Pseudomonas prosekii]|uniref:hypothetical protein n=1 Tax=Pseudomonas prosekii TaxID=1148509 RepID=UPI0011EB0321|nr:hypothetical protein [Pseudomonas prosekii]
MKSTKNNEHGGPPPATDNGDAEAKTSQSDKRKLVKQRREFFGSNTSNTLTADAIQEWSSWESITKSGVAQPVAGEDMKNTNFYYNIIEKNLTENDGKAAVHIFKIGICPSDFNMPECPQRTPCLCCGMTPEKGLTFSMEELLELRKKILKK